MDTLTGTVALITGASSGIGEGIAKMLAAEGVKVALVARRHHELQHVAEAIRYQGGTALIAPADLRDEQALRAVVEQTRTMLGPVDILVNSGGTVDTTPIHEIDVRAWDACLDINLRAPTLAVRSRASEHARTETGLHRQHLQRSRCVRLWGRMPSASTRCGS